MCGTPVRVNIVSLKLHMGKIHTTVVAQLHLDIEHIPSPNSQVIVGNKTYLVRSVTHDWDSKTILIELAELATPRKVGDQRLNPNRLNVVKQGR